MWYDLMILAPYQKKTLTFSLKEVVMVEKHLAKQLT
jgi:hypothetical protein